MKTTLAISDDLFRKAKAFAALRGQTFGNLIEQSLRKVLLDSPSSRDSLGLDELLVVKPRGNGYPLEENIRVLTLVGSVEFCDAIFLSQHAVSEIE